MRQIIALLLVVILVANSKLKTHIPNRVILSEPTPVEQFMDKIAEIETPGGGYQTVNKYGMMGRYQFSPSTVRVLGYKITKSEFLRNPEIQDSVMVAYIRENEKLLQHLIRRYNGKVVKGVKITRASILAGAHFAGANGVTQFLVNESHTGTVDAFGTSIKKYMSYFSNFHLPPLNS